MNKEKIIEIFNDVHGRWISSEESVIWEMSCDIEVDIEELHERAEKIKNEFVKLINE